MSPQRGDVFWVQMEPVVGSEIGKTRPAAIISNNVGNRFGSRVLIAPITSSAAKIYPYEVGFAAGEGGLESDGKILLDQIRCVDKRRLGNRLGALDRQTLRQVDRALHISLDLRCPQ